jgi:hypothetical protein
MVQRIDCVERLQDLSGERPNHFALVLQVNGCRDGDCEFGDGLVVESYLLRSIHFCLGFYFLRFGRLGVLSFLRPMLGT